MDSDIEETKSNLPKKEKNKKNKKKKDVPPQPDRFEVEVEVVHEHPNKTPPVVGYFPSGFDPVKNHSGDGYGPSDFQVYRHKSMPKRLQLVVRPPGGSSVEFVGTSFSGEAAAGHRAMYALGVLDKEAGSLKIVPIAGNKIFRLEPKVKGLGASDNEPAQSTLEEMTPQQKYAETTAIWGTKKDIEKAKKKLALRQDEDPDSQRNLDVKLKNVVVNKKALENTESHVSRNIPPYDASATTPQEAYLLDKIILKGEWDYLEDIYNNLQQEEADFGSYPSFVRNRIDRLRKIKDESEKKKLSCILSYINHLIKFKDQHSFNVFSAKDHKIPVLLRHRFSNMFAITESKRLPSEKNSLLIYYVLVLTLFSDEFRTDYTDIAKDLSMNVLPVRQFYEQLGCKISRQKNIWCATLPVPLKFPELRLRKRKR